LHWPYEHTEADESQGRWLFACVSYEGDRWCVRQVAPDPDVGVVAYDWRHLEDDRGFLSGHALPDDAPREAIGGSTSKTRVDAIGPRANGSAAGSASVPGHRSRQRRRLGIQCLAALDALNPDRGGVLHELMVRGRSCAPVAPTARRRPGKCARRWARPPNLGSERRSRSTDALRRGALMEKPR
jgi:hypothetical protein